VKKSQEFGVVETTFKLTMGMLSELPTNGPTDPIKYYKRPFIGKLYLNRINRSLRLLTNEPVGRVLEVGYGAGAVQLALADGVGELHGIDLDADPSVLARFLLARNMRSRLVRGNVYDLPYTSDYFDLVVCFSVFEHLQDYRRALSEVHRVLRPGGKFLLGMPSVNKVMEAAFFAIGFKGINDLHITRPAEVARDFAEIGFRCTKDSPLDFPLRAPLGVRLYYNWLLEKP